MAALTRKTELQVKDDQRFAFDVFNENLHCSTWFVSQPRNQRHDGSQA